VEIVLVRQVSDLEVSEEGDGEGESESEKKIPSFRISPSKFGANGFGKI
jgi:hypothetical protein